MKTLFALIFFSFFCGSIQAQSLKRMLKLLEKEDFQQLEEVLGKSYEKDSINSVANYVHSLLYLQKNFTHYSLDSAYVRILQSLADWQRTNPKQKEKYQKSGVSSVELDSLKMLIESKGYNRAEELNTVADFQYFMDFFESASEVESARERRNELAFENARSKNTYESYLYFLNTYPEARQVNEAKELYDIRLYQEKTADGNSSSYKEFIVEYPQSPFRIEAEKQLFDQITASNQKSDYLNFLQSVEHKFFTRKAVNFLFHSFQEDYDEWIGQIDLDNALIDSLDEANRLNGRFLIPFFEISKYGFMDREGNVYIPKSLDYLTMESICDGLEEDVIITQRNGNDVLLGRNMEMIYEGAFENVVDLGYGILELTGKKGNFLVHKGGELINQGLWEEAKIIAGTFIGIHLPEGWQLMTLSGVKIPIAYTKEIQEFHDLVFLKKEDNWAFSGVNELINPETDLEFLYTEIDWEENYFTVTKDDLKYVFDKNGIVKTKEGYDQVEVSYDRWLLTKNEQTFLIQDENFEQPIQHQEMKWNNKFGLAGNSEQWALLNHNDSLSFDLSDPVFIGDQFLMATRNDSLMLYFHPDSIPFALGDAFPELITNAGQGLIEEPTEFILIVEGKSKKLINNKGQIITGLKDYEKLVLQGNEYLIVSKRGKKGIINLSGEELLLADYDAIGNYNNSMLALLKKGRFGSFRYFPSVMILPDYDIAIEEFNANHFKARKDGLFGLLDAEGEILLDFQYDDILQWSDSMVMVKSDFRWRIVNVHDEEVFLEDIKDFKVLSGKEERITKVLTGTGYGILSNKRGIIVPPVYSELHYFYTKDEYTYFCEKYIEEASFHVLIYINDAGKIIKKQAFEEEDFQMIFCDSD